MAARRGNEKHPGMCPGEQHRGIKWRRPGQQLGCHPERRGWDEPSWLRPLICTPQGSPPAWAAQGPPLQEGCGGQRVCWSQVLKCPFASWHITAFKCQAESISPSQKGESLGLVYTGLSSPHHTPPAPHHFSVTVPAMSGQPGLTRGSEVPWGPVGGTPSSGHKVDGRQELSDPSRIRQKSPQ